MELSGTIVHPTPSGLSIFQLHGEDQVNDVKDLEVSAMYALPSRIKKVTSLMSSQFRVPEVSASPRKAICRVPEVSASPRRAI